MKNGFYDGLKWNVWNLGFGIDGKNLRKKCLIWKQSGTQNYDRQLIIMSDKDGRILTDKREVIKRWKQYFDKHLNDAETAGNDGQDNDGYV